MNNINMKQLAILGGGVAAVSKFYFGHETKTAIVLGVVAILAAGISDNIAAASAPAA